MEGDWRVEQVTDADASDDRMVSARAEANRVAAMAIDAMRRRLMRGR